MKALLLASIVMLGGCSLLDRVPPVEMCVVYKGKQICARKVNGVWSFSATLTEEEKADIVKTVDGE